MRLHLSFTNYHRSDIGKLVEGEVDSIIIMSTGGEYLQIKWREMLPAEKFKLSKIADIRLVVLDK